MEDLAIDCKILSIIIWIPIASLRILFDLAALNSPVRPRDVPVRDWENAAYHYRICLDILVLFIIVLLALVPNRWLVASRKAFALSLAMTLIPLCALWIQNWRVEPLMTFWDYLDPRALAAVLFVFGPLPTSITLSFWRKQRDRNVST